MDQVLLSAFSDNEGIIFVTKDEYHTNNHRLEIIQFHRLYHQNWLYLGQYSRLRPVRQSRIYNTFRSMFLLYGRFVLYEEVEECAEGFRSFCLSFRAKAPNFYLLDHETDSFELLKSNINYTSYDFITVET